MRSTLLGIAASVLILTACNNESEEEEMMQPDMPTGMLTVSDQLISQNTIVVSNVNLDQDGWIVVHANQDDSPVVPDIISEPVFVQAGESSDIEVVLNDFSSFSDDTEVWVMLHTDDGEAGVYEFDGANGLDAPLTASGDEEEDEAEIVMTQINISSPTVTVNDQVVNENMIVIEEVNAAVDGWIVIHEDDGDGNPGLVMGQTFVEAGNNSDVTVNLGSATFSGGEMLFPMLHIESPADGEYGFPDNGDGPEVFGNEVIVVGFETEAPTGSISAEDQIVQGNTITVSELTVNATAWVVVHASNEAGDGPQVPGIISTPVQLEAGSNTDVEIELTETVAADDVLYIMLHTENGTIGEYEFDGENGFDGPITTQSITVQAPSGSFTANDQTLTNGNVIVESITVGQPSWVVIHRDNGMGSFVAPGIISEPVALEAGRSDNVEISLADGETVSEGETIWIMLHNDNGTVGTYEFDGANGLDNPITFSSIEVSPATATNYDVTNDGASAYIFSGNGLTNSSNPDITLVRGQTYTFTVNASGHPFYINDTQGTGTANAYNSGVSNNGAQSGTVTFTVPNDAPDILFYNCEFHGSMTGTITITD